MAEERVVSSRYVKLLAIDTSHINTRILIERNADNWHDVDDFMRICGHMKDVIIYVIHMNYEEKLTYKDYQKIFPNIHWFDYMEDLLGKKQGKIINYREPMD